jgi:coproporphyrinogen III oxidase-like Fe-S oxidoreductase
MYKDKKFKIRTVDDIKEDIFSAKNLYGDLINTIFFADGNSIIMKDADLIEIMELCYALFPYLERITTYGAAKFVLKKSTERLYNLKEAGLKRLHMGLESGDESILKYVNKGATSEEILRASKMVMDAGIQLSQYVIIGLGGCERWYEHAVATAHILNMMNPHFIRIRTLVLREPAPLYYKFKTGEFKPATPLQKLEELKMLIENLDVRSRFYSDHVSNYIDINGELPFDKSGMLEKLDRFIKKVKNDRALQAYLADDMRINTL